MDGNFKQPRAGRNNDKAHPPIHPVNYVAPSALNPDEGRVYEFITRRFLGCCSEDAKGHTTTVGIRYGPETFHANGLMVLERNYLDVYTYDRWESSQQLPNYQPNEAFKPTEANMKDGKTTAPGYLTEPELISLMDANGIGTDATMAEHIAKIKEREYVIARPRGGGGRGAGIDESAPTGRGRGRGRGARGGAVSSRGGGGVVEFIPTLLGMALIEGYDKLGFEVSLAKPFLRKDMELKMKAICEGERARREVVEEVTEQYRELYALAARNSGILKETVKKYVVDGNVNGSG
jgi:DNA topoisomerase-3